MSVSRTVEAWCCGIAADDELGQTDVKVYASREDVLIECQCASQDPDRCAPRKLSVTFETNWVRQE